MKILGLDLGTNSIGWAVVEKEEGKFQLVEKGVRIFQEGVKIEKGIEGSKAAERTGFRSARRLKFRRKLRKINTLKVLAEYGYCPNVTNEELDMWRYKKIYPSNSDIRSWLSTDEYSQKTPYYFRNIAVTEKLDLNIAKNRYIIGRAFYHMCQRRGFLSNRLESTKENEGAIKQSIDSINAEKGELTLGQYFYKKYLKGEKIRDTYTHRNEHYLEEFNVISDFQALPENFRKELLRAIFFQRPLKSQKGLVGKCVFEKNKSRCPVSRPEFEEFRMLCFINNIKIKSPLDDKLRPLNTEEREKIIPLFYRKSKDHFDFEDIAKTLAPRKRYVYYKSSDKEPDNWLFNYHMKTSVSGNPVSARFKSLFGDDYASVRVEYLKERDSMSGIIDINDIWHVLFDFDSEGKLSDFARTKLLLDEVGVKEFANIKLKRDYCSLSLKAIRKILPFLRQGLIYSHAVFVAKLEDILPDSVWKSTQARTHIINEIGDIINNYSFEKQIVEIVNGYIKYIKENSEYWSQEGEPYFRKALLKRIIAAFGKNTFDAFTQEKKNRIEETSFGLLREHMQKNLARGEFIKIDRLEEKIKSFLEANYKLSDENLTKLYHPSAIDVYGPPTKDKDGNVILGSPMISSVKNPMAMRSLHQLRKVINELIKTGIVDSNTRVNIEMARELMNANERKALQYWQRERENLRKEYASKIKEHFDLKGSVYEPGSDEILKYQLWEEQNHKCIYTGQEISLSDFLGADPKYDIEHTIPRSISFDNSQENKTLCDNRFNRSIKKNQIPSELSNHEEILSRIEHWKEKYEELDVQIQIAVRQTRGAIDKEAKDRSIQKKHRLSYERNYWYNKYHRFMMKDVPSGFKNSQIVDTGIITKYARMYLNTFFDKVYTVKGSTVADFRVIWGLQQEYEKKARVNHIHHCIDAITIACMTKENYENLARFYHEWEEADLAGIDKKPKIDKPWETFAEDLKEVENEVLISHYTPDNLPKQSKKKLRIRGKIKYNEDDKPIYQQGDSVRGSLHQQTNYGAIKRSVINKYGEKENKLLYVVRKPLDSLTPNEIKNIVDDKIREIVETGKAEEPGLKKELERLKKLKSDAEVREEIEILQQKISTIERKINSLYAIENKDGSFTPIKKVRYIATGVTNPLQVKRNRDLSKHDYKQFSNFANESNYMMGIYEGVDTKGKMKRDFILVNNLEAGNYFNGKLDYSPIPDVHLRSELPLKAILKIGTLVILWEMNASEIWELSIESINKRLYKVIGLSNQRIRSGNKFLEYATIVLKHHQEARPGIDLKTQDGIFTIDEAYMAQRKLNHNQFNALVQGYDFNINPLGDIIRL